MIPAAFEYASPTTLEEALEHLQRHADEAKLLAGGHSLLPAMKLRLAQPQWLIDLRKIPGLADLREEGPTIVLGAMTTHAAIEHSALLREQCPLLPEVAAQIGDVQVRNRGTLGGSLVHADPASDWPAPILALEAEMVIASAHGRRIVPASEFFVDMMQSAVGPEEILVEVRVPKTAASVAYVKTAQKASGFAVAGVAVVLDKAARAARVAVNGVAAKAYRAEAVEAALRGHPLEAERLAAASNHAADGIDALGDIHASSAYRAHLARVNTRRALTLAASR